MCKAFVAVVLLHLLAWLNNVLTKNMCVYNYVKNSMEGKMHVQTLQSFTLQMGDTYVVYIYISHFQQVHDQTQKGPYFAKKRQALGLVFRDFSMQTYDRSHLKTLSAIHLYRSSTASKKTGRFKQNQAPKEDPWSWLPFSYIWIILVVDVGSDIGELYQSHEDPVGPIQVLQNGLVDTSAWHDHVCSGLAAKHWTSQSLFCFSSSAKKNKLGFQTPWKSVRFDIYFGLPRAFSVFERLGKETTKKKIPWNPLHAKPFQHRKNPSAQQKHVELDFPKFPMKTSNFVEMPICTCCGPWRLHQRYGPWRHHPLQYPQSSPDHRIISVRINRSTRSLGEANKQAMNGRGNNLQPDP